MNKCELTEAYNIIENAEGEAQATLRNINHWIDAFLEDKEMRNILYALFGSVNSILEKMNKAREIVGGERKMSTKEIAAFCDFAWDTLKEKADELVDEIEVLEDIALSGKPVSADDMYNLKILAHKMEDVF